MPPAFGDAGVRAGRVVPALGDLGAQRLRGVAQRAEQPRPGARAAPARAQQLQHIVGQRHVAVLGSLALLDTDAHAVNVAVDVLGAQVAHLAQAQPRAVGHHQEASRLVVAGRGEQPRQLLAREDLGQALRGRGQRDLERVAVPAEHDAVEEAVGAAVLVDAGARQLALAQQVQQILLHFSAVQHVRAAPVMPRQPRHGINVGLLGSLGLAAQHQRVEHALSKWAHHRLLDRYASTCPRRSRYGRSSAAAFFELHPPLQRFSSTVP